MQHFNATQSRNGVPWWQQVIDADHTPTTADEARKLYNALTWLITRLERKADPYRVKAGQVLLQTRDFFPTKTAWEQWLRAKVKTCQMSSQQARVNMAWAKAALRDIDPAPDTEDDKDAWLDQNPVRKELNLDVAKASFNELAADQREAFVIWASQSRDCLNPAPPHRVQELEAEVAVLKHQVGELGSALAQARAVASERSRARSSRRELAQYLWPNPRK